MTQGALFTATTNARTGLTTLRPLARAVEPTSQAAAAHLVATGAHASQAHAVLAALVACETAPTSRELAVAMGMDRHAVARRLADLGAVGWAQKGAARGCRVAGTRAVVWEATALGLRAHRLGLPVPRPERARRREVA